MPEIDLLPWSPVPKADKSVNVSSTFFLLRYAQAQINTCYVQRVRYWRASETPTVFGTNHCTRLTRACAPDRALVFGIFEKLATCLFLMNCASSVITRYHFIRDRGPLYHIRIHLCAGSDTTYPLSRSHSSASSSSTPSGVAKSMFKVWYVVIMTWST